MRILKITVWVVLFLLFDFLIIPLFLPAAYHLERSTKIVAPKEKVYSLVSDFNYRSTWDPWLEMDSTVQLEVLGNPGEVGTGYKWNSTLLGTGSLRITELKPNDMIISDLEFKSPRKDHANVTWIFYSKTDTTHVTWALEGKLKYPVGRFMGLFMDKMMGPDLENGLSNLKNICEQMFQHPDAPRTGTIREKEMDARMVLVVPGKCRISEPGQVLSSCYQEVTSYIGNLDVAMNGAPLASYPWESHKTHPSVVDNLSLIETIIYFPVN